MLITLASKMFCIRLMSYGQTRGAAPGSNGTNRNVGTVNANALGLPRIGTWCFAVGWRDCVNNTLNIQVNNGTISGMAWSRGAVALIPLAAIKRLLFSLPPFSALSAHSAVRLDFHLPAPSN